MSTPAVCKSWRRRTDHTPRLLAPVCAAMESRPTSLARTLVAALLCTAACTAPTRPSQATHGPTTPPRAAPGSGIGSGIGSENGSENDSENDANVEVRELADGVWLHTSYEHMPEFGLVLSNGLLVRIDRGLLLVDTAWTDAQTEQIAQWAEANLNASITAAVVTHGHRDKMGGVGALVKRGIATYALDITNQAASSRGLTPARETLTLENDVASLFGGTVEVFYPGPGHTADNVVVYVAGARVLFGGCLIRPGKSKTLGNTADADVGHWDKAVERVQSRYGQATHVVPSHGPPGSLDLLAHTIERVRAHRADNPSTVDSTD